VILNYNSEDDFQDAIRFFIIISFLNQNL